MTVIQLKDATQAQLYRYATVNLNLPSVQPSTGEEKLRTRIKAATGEDVIHVQESAEQEEHAKKPRNPIVDKNSRRNRHNVVMDPLRFAYKDPRFLINIAAERGKGGKTPIPVSVNGTCILLPRGEPIEVPARYFFALQAAVATIIEDVIDEHNRPQRQETEVPQFQYSILRSPTDEEVDDWQDAMDELDRAEDTKRKRGLRVRDEERASA